MCEHLSCLVINRTDKIHIYFTETDHHSDILNRYRAKYSKLADGDVVAIECMPPYDKVRIDGPYHLPVWYQKKQAGIDKRIIKLANRIAPLYADYEAKRAPLYADYEAKRAPLDADYEAKRAPLYADYEAKRDTLYADYEAKLAEIPGYLARVA